MPATGHGSPPAMLYDLLRPQRHSRQRGESQTESSTTEHDGDFAQGNRIRLF